MSDDNDNQAQLNAPDPVMDDAPPPPAPNPVNEAIGMEARQMGKSVRLPKERPLPDDIRQEIRDVVLQHIKQYKITRREVARQIGVAESTLGEVLKGTYKRATPDNYLERLNSWVGDDARRRERARPIGFYPTSVFETMQSLAKWAKSNARTDPSGKALAHDLPRIAVGWGPAGCGKSLGARALAAEDPLAILVRIDQTRGTAQGLAKLILEVVGSQRRNRQGNTIETVLDLLQHSGRLLIVDEAHRLKTSGCELLRDLADVAGIPILLLATQEFYDRVTRVRTRGGSMIYDQFSSRVGNVCDLIRGLDGQGGSTRPIFSLDDVREIFRLNQVKLTFDAEQYLQATACAVGLGMLRLASSIFEKALRSATRSKREITGDLLRSAARSTLIPAGARDLEVLDQIEQILAQNVDIAERQTRRAVAG